MTASLPLPTPIEGLARRARMEAAHSEPSTITTIDGDEIEWRSAGEPDEFVTQALDVLYLKLLAKGDEPADAKAAVWNPQTAAMVALALDRITSAIFHATEEGTDQAVDTLTAALRASRKETVQS